MISRLRLEVFDFVPLDSGAVVDRNDLFDPTAAEEVRGAAFEDGYKAGWDDAIAAQAEEAAELRAAVSRNLQALSFSYHDARSHVLRSLAPLLTDIAARILPEIARASLPQVVVEAIGPLAEVVADAPLRVVLHSSVREAVESAIGPDPGLPIVYENDDSLAPGKVTLSLGTTETRVDIDAALGAIRDAIDDFFLLNLPETQEPHHG